MDWDWTALGKAVRSRRDALRLTQERLGELAGVHPGTIKNYETGKRGYDKIPKGALQIAEALGWTSASVQAVLEGGEPTLLPARNENGSGDVVQPEEPAPLPPLKDRLPLRVRLELEGGEIADYDQYDLTVGDGARIITFLRIDPATPGRPRDPEELRRVWREWEQVKRRQRGLKPLPWEPGDPEEWKSESEA